MDRASAEGSKHQTIREAIKGLFKDAVRAVTRHGDEDEPEPRRKGGETEGEFRRLARYLWRRFDARQGNDPVLTYQAAELRLRRRGAGEPQPRPQFHIGKNRCGWCFRRRPRWRRKQPICTRC